MARFRSDDWIGAQIDKAAEAREMVKVKRAEECVARYGLRPNKEGYSPNFVSIKRFDEVLRQRDDLQVELEKYYPYTTSELGETIDKLEAERDDAKNDCKTWLDMLSWKDEEVGGLVKERDEWVRIAGAWHAELNEKDSDLARLREKFQDVAMLAVENGTITNSYAAEALGIELCDFHKLMRDSVLDPPASGETTKATLAKAPTNNGIIDWRHPCEPKSPTPAEATKAEAPTDTGQSYNSKGLADEGQCRLGASNPEEGAPNSTLEPCPDCGAITGMGEQLDHWIGFVDGGGFETSDGVLHPSKTGALSKLPDEHISLYWMACFKCGVSGPIKKTKSAARAAWNGMPRDYRKVLDNYRGVHKAVMLAERVRELIKDKWLYLKKPRKSMDQMEVDLRPVFSPADLFQDKLDNLRELKDPWGPKLDHKIVDELKTQLDMCRIGGNHIANVLIQKAPRGWQEYKSTREASKHLTGDLYDLWCCWRVIMDTAGDGDFSLDVLDPRPCPRCGCDMVTHCAAHRLAEQVRTMIKEKRIEISKRPEEAGPLVEWFFPTSEFDLFPEGPTK